MEILSVFVASQGNLFVDLLKFYSDKHVFNFEKPSYIDCEHDCVLKKNDTKSKKTYSTHVCFIFNLTNCSGKIDKLNELYIYLSVNM